MNTVRKLFVALLAGIATMVLVATQVAGPREVVTLMVLAGIVAVVLVLLAGR